MRMRVLQHTHIIAKPLDKGKNRKMNTLVFLLDWDFLKVDRINKRCFDLLNIQKFAFMPKSDFRYAG